MSSVTPEERLWHATCGMLVTRALAIVADLHVADVLAAGPRSVDELATEVDTDPVVLRRLLRALASEGIFADERIGVGVIEARARS
jgi:hypothetical protein